MAVTVNPFSGSSGDKDIEALLRKVAEKSASSGRPQVSIGMNDAERRLTAESAQLSKSLATTRKRISGAPEVLRQGELDELLARANRIATGQDRKSTGVFGAVMNSPLGSLITEVPSVLGAAQRGIVSTAKELTDLATGQGASFNDFVKQINDPTFGIGKVMKEYGWTTGNQKLDGIIAFAGDVLTDPLTYVGFTGAEFAGRGGRLNLATKAMETANLAKAPSLASKFDDIVRYGEWALDDAERAVLNVPKGLRWGQGVNAPVISGTGKAAEAVGATWAKARAFLGDFDVAQKIMAKTMPASYAGLGKLGRGAGLDQVEATRALAHWSAAKQGKGLGRVWTTKVADKYNDLFKRVAESPYNSTLFQVVEGTRTAVDDAERALADEVIAFQDDLRNLANEEIGNFAKKRGVSGDVGIRYIDDYYHHSLSEEAAQWLARNSDSREDFYLKILQNGELSADDLVNGVGPARMRRLTKDSEFLGETLQTGSLDEINRISQEKLGFKWFKEDAATVMGDYLYSMGNAARRVAYLDRLFDFGPDVIKTMTKKLVPNIEEVAAWKKTVQALYKVQRILRKDIEAGIQSVSRELQGQAARSAKAIEAMNALDVAQRNLDEFKTVVAEITGPERSSYELIIDATQKNITTLQRAIEDNTASKKFGLIQLQNTYMKVFPNAKRIPQDPDVLIAKIDVALGRSKAKLETMKKVRDELSRKIKNLRREYNKYYGPDWEFEVEAYLLRMDDEISSYEMMVQAAESSPYSENGLVYIPVRDLENADDFGFIADVDASSVNMMGAAPDQVVAARAPDAENVLDISDPNKLDDFHFMISEGLSNFIDAELGGLGGVRFNLGQGATQEFMDYLDEIYRFYTSGGNVIPKGADPLFAQTYPELTRILGAYDRYMRVAIDAKEFGYIPENVQLKLFKQIEENLNDFAASNGLDPLMGQAGVRYILTNETMANAQYVGTLVPTRIIDDTAEEGVMSLALPRTTAVFRKGDDFYQPATLASSSARRDVTYGKYGMNPMEMLQEAKGEVAQQMELYKEYQDLIGQIRELNVPRSELTAEMAKVRKEMNAIDNRFSKAKKRYAGKAQITLEDTTQPIVGKPKPFQEKRIPNTPEAIDAALAEADKSAERAMDNIRKLERKGRSIEVTGPSGATGTVAKAENAVNRARRAVDKVSPLLADRDNWTNLVEPQYRQDIDTVLNMVDTAPPRGVAGDSASAWAMRSRRLLGQVDEAVRLDPEGMDALNRVVTQLIGDEADLAVLETTTIPRAEQMLTGARMGTVGGRLVDDVERGWVALEGLGVQIPKDIRDMAFGNLRKLGKKNEWEKYFKVYNQYHQFFKTYATLTPGFTIRNSLSSTFMNYVMGVTTENMILGLKAAKAYMKYGPSKWLDNLGLSASERALWERAWQVTSSTGAGQTMNDIMGPVLNGKAGRILNNKATRLSARGNEAAEFAARFSMALNDLKAGLSFDEAAGRISRVHFDYTDLSQLDRGARAVVPFWIWTSRNVPLQIASMWTRPAVYNAYQNLKENLPPDSNLLMPKWLAEKGPIGLGGGTLLTPDLPQVQLRQNIEQISDPKRLLGQLNPALKLPFEAFSDKQFSSDIPFGTKPVKAEGLDLLAALIGIPLGQTSVNAKGEFMISPKLQYQVANFLPPLARAQRLVPETGGKPSYGPRRLSSWATALGLPLRELTAEEQGNEAIRRQKALESLIIQLRNQGWVPNER